MTDRNVALLSAFIDQNIYNGAPGAGQAIYNYGGNPWLHERVEQFLRDYYAEEYFSDLESMFGDDKRLMNAVQQARTLRATRRTQASMDAPEDWSK